MKKLRASLSFWKVTQAVKGRTRDFLATAPLCLVRIEDCFSDVLNCEKLSVTTFGNDFGC